MTSPGEDIGDPFTESGISLGITAT